MADRKTIAVVGATGAQGGGLVRAILEDQDGGFTARAITRDPDGDKARALASRGAEVVGATVDDEDSLVRAFDGADAAYLVTFYWEHMSPEKETRRRSATWRGRRRRPASSTWSGRPWRTRGGGCR